MPAGVEHFAAAHPRRIGSPGEGALAHGEVTSGRQGKAAMLEALDRAQVVGLAEHARLEQPPRFDQRRLEELVVAHHEDDARLVEHVADLLGVLKRGAERLLAEDCLAGAGRVDDRVRVEMMRQADVDRLHVRIGQQLLDAGVDLRLAARVVIRQVLRPGLRHVRDRDELPARGVGLPADGVLERDPARAEQTDLERCHRTSASRTTTTTTQRNFSLLRARGRFGARELPFFRHPDAGGTSCPQAAFVKPADHAAASRKVAAARDPSYVGMTEKRGSFFFDH